MENFVDVRLSAEEAELIDFALDLVVDAYGKNLDQGGIGEFDHPTKLARKASQVNEFILQLYLCQKRKKPDISQIFS